MRFPFSIEFKTDVEILASFSTSDTPREPEGKWRKKRRLSLVWHGPWVSYNPSLVQVWVGDGLATVDTDISEATKGEGKNWQENTDGS